MGRRSKNDAEELQPEELVRRETKVVNFLRVLLFVVLIVVGSLLSYGSYKVGHKWEEEAYQKEFNAIATRLTAGFKTSVTQIMWNGGLIGSSVSASSDLISAAPNISIPNFDQLAMGAVQTNHIGQVYWAPFLKDETQRQQWEAFARHQMNSTESAPQNSVCHVCGNASFAVQEPSKEVTLPIGRYACGKPKQ